MQSNNNNKIIVPLSSTMLKLLHYNLRRLCSHLRNYKNRKNTSNNPKIIIKTKQPEQQTDDNNNNNHLHHHHPHNHNSKNAAVFPNSTNTKHIRVATFNAALFSMAPALPQKPQNDTVLTTTSQKPTPKGILKQSPLHPNSINGEDSLASKQQKFAKSRLRVSINLPDNEISLGRSRRFDEGYSFRSSNKTVLDVLKEIDADILALQDVKAQEEREMKPLSDLAEALGMHYVFAESWAPEYGNAVLSKWPIKTWKVQKIFDDSDFRDAFPNGL